MEIKNQLNQYVMHIKREARGDPCIYERNKINKLRPKFYGLLRRLTFLAMME
jgi:hypothetical protein